MKQIGILGTGTWGVAIARMLANNGHFVCAWSPICAEIEELSKTRTHPKIEGIRIPECIQFTSDIEAACFNKDIVIFAVPSVFIRDIARKAKHFINPSSIVVSVTKGIEPVTNYTMTDVIQDELNLSDIKLAALSGPTHAEEVAQDMLSTIVSACTDLSIAEEIQNIFMSPTMRVYTNTDVLGVEISGALKNIIALSVGIANGLGYGDNAKAALITRGIAEISRLGSVMGCLDETFSGLAGVGDLIVTATSEHSRNFKAGRLIGKGYSLKEAVSEVGMVVEGINALPAAMELSYKYNVDMPIISAVNDIIMNGANPIDKADELMTAEKKSELKNSSLVINFEKAMLNNKRSSGMKRVITYGTFDLLHYGHINILKRAKALGDYLVVVVSTDEFNWNEKQKKCYFTYEQRKALVEAIRYVDLVIPETSWEQKRTDIHEYHIDTFVMGDDWKGKFDFLEEEGVEVVYLPRTPEISTTQIKTDLGK